jgi:5-(carboxyamino)imidazole ribonucleotide synthase
MIGFYRIALAETDRALLQVLLKMRCIILEKNYLAERIGIIGGGQLGKMMILEAKKLGFYVVTLDPSPKCPSHSISDEHIVADFDDAAAIEKLAEKTDVITYEFEHISCEALYSLCKKGYKVYPSPKSLEVIQNKLSQKKALASGGLPVPEFAGVGSLEDIYNVGDKFGYPFILKTCTGGYDGKGNAVVSKREDVKSAYLSLGSGSIPLMAERFVPFIMETSVLACRGLNGDTVVYPVGDNRHKDSILFETVVPAAISQQAAENAMRIAKKVMDIFDGIGMFCVEMFVTESGEVLINEVAPRPHNSGHYTIEGCVTSQFENHIRAITALPLGSTELIRPTVMINLLGKDGYEGETYVKGIYDALNVEGCIVHIYGKEVTKPKRKMGHITVTADTVEKAAENAEKAFDCIKIISL